MIGTCSSENMRSNMTLFGMLDSNVTAAIHGFVLVADRD